MKMGNPKKSSRFICLSHIGENYVGSGIQRGRFQREKKHIKDLYCCQCKKVTKNLEVRYCDDFQKMMDASFDLHFKYYSDLEFAV